MDCSLPGFSAHRISQVRLLEWVAISFSRDLPNPGIEPGSLTLVGRFLTIWATREAHDKPRQCIKKQRRYFANKGPSSQSYGFSSSHGQMWELDHEESWALTNWCFQIVVLENSLQSPLDCKEIKPVNPKGNQSWIFTGRSDAEAEAPVLWLPDAKSRLIRKEPDAGKDWRREEKGTTEDEMIGWHHCLSGHEFEQILGDCEGQGSLMCYSLWDCRVGHDLATYHHHHQAILQYFQLNDSFYSVHASIILVELSRDSLSLSP